MKNKLFVVVRPDGRAGNMRGTVTDVTGGRWYHLRFDTPKRHRRIIPIEHLEQFAFFDTHDERDEFLAPPPEEKPAEDPEVQAVAAPAPSAVSDAERENMLAEDTRG